MSLATVSNGSALGGSLNTLLTCGDILPGEAPSYQLCKTLYSYHPLGAKMAETPIKLAQSQQRVVTVPAAPDCAKREFEEEWRRIGADTHIRNVKKLSRIYGIATLAMLCEEVPAGEPLDYEKLHEYNISFNEFDPLNTAGSLVLNQIPNSPDFLKTTTIQVQGLIYHRSRICVVLNEEPVYLEYTGSAFGFVGRSVYQRALYPLKSFIKTMVADDMVATKCGVLIAMMKQAGSIIDNMMMKLFGQKRQLLKEAQTTNVLSIDVDEKIETLNLQNVNSALQESRNDILKNIAVAADMPAKLLDNETFVEGFGEGTEDAKNVARYIQGLRHEMAPEYSFFDKIVMRRAWNPNYYKSIQRQMPEEYGKISYEEAFFAWSNSFTAEWPSLLEEPESEEIKVDDVKLKATIALLQVLAPMVDPKNVAALIQWAADNFNARKMLFESPLVLDYEELERWAIEQQASRDAEPAFGEGAEEPREPKPFASADSMESYDGAVTSLLAAATERRQRRIEARRQHHAS